MSTRTACHQVIQEEPGEGIHWNKDTCTVNDAAGEEDNHEIDEQNE